MGVSLFEDLAGFCRSQVSLADFTWYRIGGPARWFATPRNEAELCEVVARCRQHEIPWRVLGNGANLLVRDQGFDGLVIHLGEPLWAGVEMPETEGGDASPLPATSWQYKSGDNLARDRIQSHQASSVITAPECVRIRAGAGADFPRLVKRSANRGFGGLERLAGIPGTLGGIVRMNAGGKYGSISEFVESVRVLEQDGTVRERPVEAVGFRYRHSQLAGCIVLGATLQLQRGDPADATARFREVWNEKAASQPAVSERSCGCIFKNPPKAQTNLSAGALIDQAGLKGMRVGGAEVSTRHANFIVARADASAQDVIELIDLARERVRDRTGVVLELEVEIW